MSIPLAAERNLIFKRESGQEEPVVVRVFVPYRIEQGDWQCDYEIRGNSFQRTFHAIGIDSAQALTLVIGNIRADLEYDERKHKGIFYFLGEPGHEFK
jgi:hypothetical protein